MPEDVLVLKEMTGSLDRRDLFERIISYETGMFPYGFK